MQGEALTFVGSGATGKLLDTDSTGAGTGTYVTYGITAGDPAANDVVTGGTSTATCVLTSGTADNVNVIWQGQCQNQEFSGAGTQLTIGGSTASAAAYKELTTATGASFRDNANAQTNALQYNVSNGAGIRTTTGAVCIGSGDGNVRISKLQVSAIVSGGNAIRDTSGSLLDYLILEGGYVGTSTSQGVVGTNSGALTIRNSVLILRVTAADHIAGFGSDTSCYNCTLAASDDLATAPTQVILGIVGGSYTIQNCGLFAGDSTKGITSGAGTFTFTTCYSDISGTTGVTQTTYSSEFQNVNDATRDFRLVTGAAQKDTGTTDVTNAANDIVGTARPSGAAYDVGCWEFVQAVAASATLRIISSPLRW